MSDHRGSQGSKWTKNVLRSCQESLTWSTTSHPSTTPPADSTTTSPTPQAIPAQTLAGPRPRIAQSGGMLDADILIGK